MGVTVSCLIPAWNEASRIAAVLKAAVGHPLLTEVIVIDDGSTDETASLAAAHGAQVLSLTRNGGKSAAIAAGLNRARGDLVLLLDADLHGLESDHITALLRPVLGGNADASLSLRGNAPWLWRWIGLDYISGERVLPRDLVLPHLHRITRLSRFGLEVFVNSLWLEAGLKLAVVRWDAVASPTKARKQGFWRGIRADIRMMSDIFRTISPLGVVGQILRLRHATLTVMETSSSIRTTFTEVK